MDRRTNNVEESLSSLRNSFHDLIIQNDTSTHEIWIQKLNNILNSDIHRRPLGCKIDNTHIKIGDIHMESFYEARILFSHARWVDYFTRWLKEQIEADIDVPKEPDEMPLYVFLIGYETYIEPILHALRWKLISCHSNWIVRYGTYEEPKFLQSTGDQISDVRIRFLDRSFPSDIIFSNKNTRIFNICGISSTLSTFGRIDTEICKIFRKNIEENHKTRSNRAALQWLSSIETSENAIKHYALIQVLPSNSEIPMHWKFADNTKTLEWSIGNSCQPGTVTAVQKKDFKDHASNKADWTITAKYLTSVSCFWNNADSCRLCYPIRGSEYYPLGERPIIATSETSMVPIQMIELSDVIYQDEDNEDKQFSDEDNENKQLSKDSAVGKKKPIDDFCKCNDSIDFFEHYKVNGSVNYKYRDYLYSGHTGRMDNHFKYYIRTGALFQKILEDSKSEPNNNVFLNFCSKIRRQLFPERELIVEESLGELEPKDITEHAKNVDIIISTTDYSDNAFANAINEYVFNSQAHMISLDPKKEFRSNFLTKYSNISYFIEQTKSKFHKDINIRFFFIDDQIIVGDAFYRARSLVQSLMAKKDGTPYGNTRIFEAVIVLLSRNSRSTKADYVTDPKWFFSLISINVPSIRSYADSCPLCKLRSEALEIAKKSALAYTERYWTEKSQSYRLKTLKDARNSFDITAVLNPDMIDRQFRRFHCENILWEALGRKANLPKMSDEREVGEIIVSTIRSTLKDKDKIGRGKGVQFEYLIGFINALSKPFLYFKEDNKKIALQFSVQMIEKLCSSDVEAAIEEKSGAIVFDFSFSTKTIRLSFPANKRRYGVYSLLLTLINCLAAMDSTYLLYAANIKKIIELGQAIESVHKKILQQEGMPADAGFCDFAPIPSKKYSGFYYETREALMEKEGQARTSKQEQIYKSLKSPYLFDVLFHAIKRALSGTSKEYKRSFFHNELKKLYETQAEDCREKKLWNALYVENSVPESDDTIIKEYIRPREKQEDLLKCYNTIAEKIREHVNRYTDRLGISCRITELSFLYLDKPMNRSYKLADSLIRLEDGALEKQVGYYEGVLSEQPTELTQLGCGKIERSKYIIAVHTDWGPLSDEQKKIDDDEKVPDYSQIRAIFMQLSCEGTLLKKDVMEYIVCPVLSFRHELKERFSLDLVSNAVRNAIQAKAGEALVKSNKTISHGHSRDIFNAINILIRFGQEAFEKKDLPQIPDFNHIERLLSLFMNLCISKTNNQKIKNDYFQTEPKKGNQERQADLFNNTCKRIPEDMRPLCRFLIKSFFREITKPDYPNTIDPVNTKKFQIHIMYNEKPEQECSSVEKAIVVDQLLDAVPLFMVPINTEEENLTAIFCLMGMMGALVRNALEHGGQSANGSYEILIYLKPGSNAGQDNFCVRVENPRKPQADENKPQGITWHFFDEVSEESRKIDEYTGFEVRHDEDAEHFVAEIIMRCGFKQSDSSVDDLHGRGNEDEECDV